MDEEERDVQDESYESEAEVQIAEGQVKYGVTAKVALSQDTSVTARHLVVRHDRSQECLLAASLTDHTIQIYKGVDQMNKIATFKGHTKTITGLKLSESDANRLYSSSEDGTLRMWDLRQNVQVGKLEDDSDGRLKPFCSFDVNGDDTFACCGTELIREDAFLLFWDLRSSNLLGGYWESHTDDITNVHFNPKEPNLIASGSTDGLINTFDITESTEDDALLNTMNTESSADVFRWCSSSNCNIACLTHVETLQLWDAHEACRLASFSRDDIESLFKVPTTIFVSLSSSQSGILGTVVTSRTGQTLLLEVEDNKTFVKHGVLSGAYTKPISTAHWNVEV